MIKIPKEIENVLSKLENGGYKAHVIGECVADALRGEQPLDWDIVTDAHIEDLNRLFDTGHVFDRESGIYRIEFDEEDDEGIIVDIAHYRSGGRLVDDILEDLAGRSFSCNAMAVDRRRNVVDPYSAKTDVQKRLVRTIGSPDEMFAKDPIKMMEIIRTAAMGGADLPKAEYEAILGHKELLRNVSIEEIRDEFMLIVDAYHAGKGLRMLDGTGLLEYIIGDRLANHPSKREKKDFDILCDGIDNIQHVVERRLGCFYLCYDGGKCENAIRMLRYDAETEQHLIDAIIKMPMVYFIKTKEELKRFIADYGLDRYNYLHNLSKAQRIIWDGRDDKIQNRNYLWKEIENNNEILFEEQLPVTREEIIEAGYATDATIDKMMRMLLDVAFNKPRSAISHDMLMIQARKFKKNKIKAATRNVKWIK